MQGGLPPRGTAPLYRIPSEEDVLDAVHECLREGRANSQNELARKVLGKMTQRGLPYTVSPSRARRIASKSPNIRVRTVTRRSDREMKRCPFCGNALERVRTRDIFGAPTLGSKTCSECGFRVAPGRLEPGRYIFELR